MVMESIVRTVLLTVMVQVVFLVGSWDEAAVMVAVPCRTPVV